MVTTDALDEPGIAVGREIVASATNATGNCRETFSNPRLAFLRTRPAR